MRDLLRDRACMEAAECEDEWTADELLDLALLHKHSSLVDQYRRLAVERAEPGELSFAKWYAARAKADLLRRDEDEREFVVAHSKFSSSEQEARDARGRR